MQISKGEYHGTLTRYCVSGWNIQHIDFHRGTSSCFRDAPRDRHGVLLPLTVSRHNKLLGRPVQNSTLGLYAPGSEHADVTREGSRHVVIVPAADLTDEISALREFLPATGAQSISVPEAVLDQFRGLIEDIHASVEQDEQLLGKPAVIRSLSDALQNALSGIAECALSKRVRGRPEHPRPALVRELQETLAAANGAPIFATELCRSLNISFPTLRRMFLDWYGVPPARYLLMRRYYLARERIRSGQYESVSEAAQSCGFWNPSRFAASYRALFRELPSATLSCAPQRNTRRPAR